MDSDTAGLFSPKDSYVNETNHKILSMIVLPSSFILVTPYPLTYNRSMRFPHVYAVVDVKIISFRSRPGLIMRSTCRPAIPKRLPPTSELAPLEQVSQAHRQPTINKPQDDLHGTRNHLDVSIVRKEDVFCDLASCRALQKYAGASKQENRQSSRGMQVL